MERRSFLKQSAMVTGAALSASSLSAGNIPASEKEVYELKVFQLKGGGGRNKMKQFYTEAMIPFLNSRGAKVGAFNEYSQDDPPRIYILHAHKSPADYFETLHAMKTDRTFLNAAQEYMQLPADQAIFERYETFLSEAFDAIPRLKTPDSNRSLFELRTYESYNEDAGNRKVKMFNDEELPLFEKVGLHPVFFGQLIAGRQMPALIYMLWFTDMEQRNTNWDKFRISSEWNVMKNKPEYADTVSKVNKKFLTPMDFSQL